ncbi:nitronate monooxygenase family protein [Maricurvus nonylphenolicus]|uniref:NAD(P)H-dependent flavin oxidoreductase n=1 Tax=Maricurvus nonylphenolicus TaxID=1008307 RepID=UPI0036F31ED0
MNRQQLQQSLKLPAIQAPMFLISGPDMVINACRSGIVGCFPTPNARTTDILDQWMTDIKAAVENNHDAAPWAVNLIVHPSYPRRDADLDLILKHKPPIVITALGSPRDVVEKIHAYGGLVLADVINPTFARKAASAGVDGLVLVSAGAGGHTGYLSPFVFVEEIRQWFDGILVLGGGIATGAAIHATQTMGADFAYLGTRFIPTEESLCQQEYKTMVVESNADDIITSDAITGVKANWMRQSLINGGYDPDNMPAKGNIDFANNGADNKRWKDIWAAGQGVGASDQITSIANIVNQLHNEYQQSVARMQQLSLT